MNKFYVENGELYFRGSLETDSVRQALEWSIEKWEVLAKHLEVSTEAGVSLDHVETCALCGMFRPKCIHCPVYQESGHVLCKETPFESFCDRSTAANAWREMEFLCGLLERDNESTT